MIKHVLFSPNDHMGKMLYLDVSCDCGMGPMDEIGVHRYSHSMEIDMFKDREATLECCGCGYRCLVRVRIGWGLSIDQVVLPKCNSCGGYKDRPRLLPVEYGDDVLCSDGFHKQ